MMESLEIVGYRCFKTMRLDGLTRVNVVVGRNNAGKTSLLDAVELLLLRNEPSSLVRSLWRRQEVRSRGIDPQGTKSDVVLDAGQLFHGREVNPNSSFIISAITSDQREMRIEARIDSAHVATMLSRHVLVTSATNSLQVNAKPNIAQFDYEIHGAGLAYDVGALGAPDQLNRPFIFAGTGNLGGRERARLWDLIVGNEEEDLATNALRILEPNIDRVIFTVGDSHGGSPSPFVRMKGSSERIPLGNLGHGASRLFELAILLAHARGGVFMVDEIEVGLHYMAMESVWRMILETAQKYDIQVFATTHSKDCTQALASLYRRERTLENIVSLHRLDAGATHSDRFSMDDVQIADDARVELRGLS
jgi:predicted ATP-dependent endonuclease of OLD family